VNPRYAYAEIATAVVALLLLVCGCKTASEDPHLQTAKATSSPFLSRRDYSETLGLTLHDVLARHRFTLPWTVVRGPDSAIWFVAERFEDNHRFDRLFIRNDGVERVTASITPYVQGPSDWAILGKLFNDRGPQATETEAESIAAEIRGQLSGKTGPAR
jgi:hypothetical protein